MPVPLRWVGPIRLAGPDATGDVRVPLATFESPLWPSVDRGARATRAAGGIRVVVLREGMTRSVLLEAPDAAAAVAAASEIEARQGDLAQAAQHGSRHARLLGLHAEVCGALLYLRLTLDTGEAAGHNMATRAAQQALDWIARQWPTLRPVSVSANYCVDKKVSAINAILGRGRQAIAEAVVPAEICRTVLRVEPAAMADLNLKKNLVGSILAGSLRSANAHHANMLLALYLATGQDGANVVEGSQGVTLATVADGALRFSVTLPNVIVGVVGAGKDCPAARRHLEALGCAPGTPGAARRLAAIAAAVVLCGELSLLAALANPGELVRSHLRLERKGRDAR